jgi:N-acyl-D-amino-acid deacylase
MQDHLKRYDRRRFLKHTTLAALGVAASGLPRLEASTKFDLIVRGGTILDGTGGPPWKADVGIAGDTIKAIGEIAPELGKSILDASGLHVCPGFVDIHSHSDGAILKCPTAESRFRQGFTTEVTGNCGGSLAPFIEERWKKTKEKLAEEGIELKGKDVAALFEAMEQRRPTVNQAMLLGHGTLRTIAIGEVDRHLTEVELKGLIREVEKGMDQGAFGISTGLEYSPGLFTPTEELIALTRVVSRRGGLYASHIRDEVDGLLEAVNEVIEIGRETGARVQVSHLKAAGEGQWNNQAGALRLLEAAQRQGIEALADVYPYKAYNTGLAAYLPAWSQEGGNDALLERLRNKDDRTRIRKELESYVQIEPGDFDLIVINGVKSKKNRHLVGMNLSEIGTLWKIEPVDALFRLLKEEELRVWMIGHAMSAENVEMVLTHPLVMVGSDGRSMSPGGDEGRLPHPRNYGTCARVLGHYVRDRGVLELPKAIRKMTHMPADQAGIRDRGRIARGLKADLVAFDTKAVKDLATFQEPERYPSGIVHVLVNGVPVMKDSESTGARPGRVLRKG